MSCGRFSNLGKSPLLRGRHPRPSFRGRDVPQVRQGGAYRGDRRGIAGMSDPKPGAYYWARHEEGSTFVVLFESGEWYCCGVDDPIAFNPAQLVCEVEEPI